MCGNDCRTTEKRGYKKPYGLLSGLLLLLIPKCPFCFMAFSSALVLCGENGAISNPVNHYSTITIILTAFFCVTSLLSILLYFRQPQGRFALMLAVPGMAALLYSVTIGGGQVLYYTGAFAVVAALLRNSGWWTLWERRFILPKKPT